jgi:hypothetical protein
MKKQRGALKPKKKTTKKLKMSSDSSDVGGQATHHVMALPFSLISLKLILPLLDLELNRLSPIEGLGLG